MTYVVIFVFLFFAELGYFQIADRFNIIDRPNERSSHTTVTLRGGGIVFYLGGLAFFIVSGFQYPYFMLGLTLMTIVSFMDDVFSLSNRVRLTVQFLAVLLMAYQLQVFSFPWYYLIITFVVVVGVINAYNFMDGINGITGCYSLAIVGLLMLVNDRLNFVAQDLLAFVMLSLLVFLFFNFRGNARCFAGDVGSVAIGYIVIFALGALVLKTGTLIYFLFLSIYGIDAVWTILRRLFLKENIFQAHRSHLYQFLGNEAGVNKLMISFVYGTLQFVIGLLTIFFSQKDITAQWMFAVILLVGGSAIYLIVKTWVIKKYVARSTSRITRTGT